MDTQDQSQSGRSLLSELLEAPGLNSEKPTDRRAFTELLEGILKQQTRTTAKIAIEKVDDLIVALDQKLSDQVNELMASAPVKALETTWRGAKYLVDAVDFRENIRLELVNASKQDLQEDFDNAPEVVESGLYRTLYREALGVYGGKPYGVVCSTHDFGPGSEDVSLLKSCAAVAAMSHVPLLSNASAAMFGKDSFQDIPDLKDMQSHFEDPRYATWNDFRLSEDARYVGLCVPRFLLRAPYGSRESELSVKGFDFGEDVIDQHERYLWAPASLALTANIASSFAKYRWCPNIIGPQAGGAVDGLPLHQYDQDGETKTVNPCEAPIEMRKEFEFSQQGFIPLVHKQGTTRAVFFSANSTQKPKVFPKTEEGLNAQRNFMLGTRLPYMFVITRLSHYIKAIVTEKIGKNMESADLERELKDWLRQYVADMDNPHPDIRAKRPLRQASVTVEEVPGQVGWYRCDLKLRPHFKFEGASFELSLVGKIDKK